MPGLYTGASGLWGGFAGLLYGSSALSTPPGLLADAGGFTPASLFAQGEQGVWYDPSDLTTLFQDAAGTTPVTAVEQPVGRILDKSGRGNHASQSTSAARPVLSARVNLLTYTEQFDNAAWNKTFGGALNSVTPNTTTAPNGTFTADTLSFMTGASRWMGYEPDIQLLAGVAYTFSIWLKRKSGSSQIRLNVNPYALSWVDVAVTSEWQQFSITQTPSSTTTPAQTCGILADNSSGDEIYIWGADLRSANAGVGLPAYQRVGAATDYDTTGFPLYLKFDGTDDFLVSGTINPGSVDKAQVFAGVRKLSDASTQMFCEYSTSIGSNTGSLVLNQGDYATGLGAYWIHGARGAATLASNQFATTPANYAAPITSVLAGYSDISGDLSVIRVNGTQQATATGDKGSGDWGSYPLYVGRRGGTSYPFSGSLYSLILRFSATNLAAATITATETWVNGKTYAY